MSNKHVITRLTAIQEILRSAHGGGGGLSSAAIGAERESFVSLVLGNVIAPPFRVGSGEITDHSGNLSGQVDIVVEYANTMSFPLLQGNATRLYLAEGVCCVIEVKSNLEKQWSEVIERAKRLSILTRKPGVVGYAGSAPPKEIPLFAVGLTGWSKRETAETKLVEAAACGAALSGILLIDSGVYVGVGDYQSHGRTGPGAIFGFLLSLEHLTSSIIASKPMLGRYVDG